MLAYRSAVQTDQEPVVSRAERGLARLELSANRPAHALAALAHRPDGNLGMDATDFRLAPSEAILAFVATGTDSLVGFLIRGGQSLEVHRLALGRSDFHEVVRSWRSRLGDSGRGLGELRSFARQLPVGPLAPEPELTIPQGKAPSSRYSWESYLEDILISPFTAGLVGVSRLTLVLDDVLTPMPIEVIGREQRLYRRFELSRSPSLDHLLARPQLIDPGDSVVFANETNPVTWCDRARKMCWHEQASTAGFRVDPAAGHSPSLYTLITANAILDPAQGRWGAAQIDTSPILTGGSLQSSDAKTRTMILAIGDPDHRDQMQGAGVRQIASGAILGGSPAVVITLWDPPAESASLLLGDLQSSLMRGISPGRALQQAREKVARMPQFADPVHWAGSVLYGAP